MDAITFHCKLATLQDAAAGGARVRGLRHAVVVAVRACGFPQQPDLGAREDHFLESAHAKKDHTPSITILKLDYSSVQYHPRRGLVGW